MTHKARSSGLVAWGGSIVLHGLALAGVLWWLSAMLKPVEPKSEPVPLSLAMLVEPVLAPQPAEPIVEAVTEPAPPEPVAEPIPEPAPLPDGQPPPSKPKPEKPKPVKPNVEKPKVEKPHIKPQETPTPAAAPTENVAPTEPIVPTSAPVAPVVPQPPAPVALDSHAENGYSAQVRQAVDQHKNYPRLSRRMQEEGRVIVEFSIAANGALLNVRIKKSSGFERLDEAALQAVRDAAPFAPFPEGSARQQRDFTLPLSFKLDA